MERKKQLYWYFKQQTGENLTQKYLDIAKKEKSKEKKLNILQ